MASKGRVRNPDAGAPKLPPSEPVQRVVGIGSSAGGLEALTEVLRSLPTGLPVAYVIAQHMSPTHDSPLAEMLGRETDLSVRVAHDGATLEPGLIMVVPPSSDVSVDGMTITLLEPGDGPGPKPSVDLLLRSIARTWGDKAVGVVLSGTGHDGSEGLRAIRAAGGLTIAQRPDTARFDGMPSAAVLTGAVDLVLSPEDIGPTLARTSMLVAADPMAADPGAEDEGILRAVVLSLRAAAGVDFSDYKPATLLRQIARRAALRDVDGMESYHQLVARDPEEARALTRQMLVTVTSFFRDKEVWDALKAPLEELVEALGPDQQMRIWVPGCATGEEAYTVAMLAATALGAPVDLPRRLKVFATDLNDESLEVARRGRYREDTLSGVPPEMLERWLRPIQGGREMAPALRDVTVFAHHNVGFDPPFPRIDLISMRNMLIYFQTPLQERVLRLCHFALVPHGLLVLGESERINDAHQSFSPVDAKHKIYRRRGVSTFHPLPSPQQRTQFAAPQLPRTVSQERDEQAALRHALIRRFAPPSLVTDANDEVVEVIGDVSPWCWVADGRHSNHVVALLRDELKPAVRSLLVQLRHGAVQSAERDLTTASGRVRIGVQRLRDEATGPAVISFTALASEADDATASHDSPAAADTAVDQVHRELESTREALQSTIEELGASNEELQVMNEELQASAEELQASTEEVQASNEELEATNEELRTLNQELQVRATDLFAVNSDLQNIERSLTSGLILVDRGLRVTRFTPLAVRLFALIDQDLGRPITAIQSALPLPTLEQDLRAALAGSSVELREVTGDQADFLVQVQPYRDDAADVRGAVIVITDIGELAAARREISDRLHDFATVTEAVREFVWQRDTKGELTFINSRVEEIFGLSQERVLADPGLLVAAVHPEDRERVHMAGAAARGRWELDYRIVRPDGVIRWIRESAVPIAAGAGGTVGSALDITVQHELAVAAEDRLVVLQAVMDNQAFGVVLLNAEGEIAQVNKVFERITGYPAESLTGMVLAALITVDEEADVAAGRDESEATGFETRLQRGSLAARDGSKHLVTLQAQPISSGVSVEARMVIVQDVTDIQTASTQLLAQARFDQQTGLAGRAYFRTRVAAELGRAQRTGHGVAILWIDLDGFKEVNDRHGHSAGDEVLNEVAARLVKSARMQDLVGRLGGDEFGILMTEATTGDRLEIVAERALTVLREPIALSQSTVYLSGSMGIALSPEDGVDAQTLLHNADTAMYAAKEQGRDRRVYFRTDMNQAAEVRAQLRHRIGGAVRNREFTMHYQPITHATTGKLQMAEALVRWQRDGEIVPAADFIGLAEQTGQIRAIGRLVLELVDRDLHAMNGSLLPIALNLSTDQLEDRETTDWLLSWQPPGGLGRIVLEITESIELSQSGRAIETLTVLQRLGATLSIDDFGTGFSNFRLLDVLRPNFIKIDQSLLAASSRDARGLEVFTAAVQMAGALAEKVVVEGIETQEQSDLVAGLGVQLSQGYHIARPMPLSDLVGWRA